MRRNGLFTLALIELSVLLASTVAFAQLPVNVSRQETLIVDQIFRYSVPNNFNMWVSGAGPTPTRQGLVADTLWYIDQQTGKWIDSLAKEPPIYSDDFKKMTVRLRKGIYWSDGVEFTADDVVFTVKNLMAHEGMLWSAEFNTYISKVYKTDDYTVVFELKERYPRFHYLFTARYNACYIQPKHVWEKVKDPMQFAFYPPVSLGAYVIKDSDPAGYWELYERRNDWQRTTVGVVIGKPGPKYILTIFYGPNEKKIMAMASHQLDLFMDVDAEAFSALVKRDRYARSWYKDFPWAWPDELDTRFFGFNLQNPIYDNKDVRWALALALDIVELQTEYIGGVTRVTPIPQPATSLHMELYHKPLEQWLSQFKLEIGSGEYFVPYDKTVPERIAAWARKHGYSVPDKPEEIREMFGIGWWKHAPDVAEKLLKKHGFKRNANGKWLLPDGTPWKISIIAAPDEVDVYRLAMGASDQWKDFGIEVAIETLERDPYYTRQNLGRFECTSSWGFGGGGGASAIPDKWPFIYSLHSRFYRPTGEVAINNILRVKSERVDRIINEMGHLPPDNPRVLELGREFMKLWVENMWSIVTISFKKFVTQDEYYWTNFPTSEKPYGQPCYWFMGGRFVFPYLEQTGRK